jgi:ATP-dependent RNA helicase DeaD
VTGQSIAVERVPTVADLRARRMELTRAALQESLVSDDLQPFSVIVESLSEEHDVMQIAMAAVRLAHEATVGSDDEEEDIPQGPPARGKDHKDKPKNTRGKRGPVGDTTNVFIGAGRVKGIRPQDLVGAICGESRLQGRDIGAIEISDRFALVEVPAEAADDVIAALQRTKIKGHKATVRRER